MEPSGATGHPTGSSAPSVGQAVRRGVFGLLVAIFLYLPAFPLAFASLLFAAGAFDDQCFSPDAGRVCPANPVMGVLAIALGIVLLIAPGAFGIYAGRAPKPAQVANE
ncbi:hypothetical protein G8C93_00100 [Cellulosimicrobium cellulans]|uniref:hypothetical protein n=1 Tax=Cellulosimicrobium cellulans TaxID=1710 RepID=UPI00188449C5|nr:hypothetical protein [Cellulosimicrobium cellulans]MBE9924295.1 hypothetical protein [Cellulosimicrobium cellulans]